MFFFIQMNKLSQKLMISIEKSYFNQQKNAKQVFPDLCKYAAFERNKSLNGQKIWAALQRFVNSKCSKFCLSYFFRSTALEQAGLRHVYQTIIYQLLNNLELF